MAHNAFGDWVSRQAVRMWAQRARIDPVASRKDHPTELWAKALDGQQHNRPKAAAPLSDPRS
jgi:hypothetical protein